MNLKCSLLFPIIFALGTITGPFASILAQEMKLRAGASAVDVTPQELPVIRNGGFLEATDYRVADPLFARCLVLDDGNERIALVVVDSCMIPRELCDAIKARASDKTDIRPDRIMISATHTHSAPSVMDYCLGSRADPTYTEYLPGKVVEAIVAANGRLTEAEAGAAVVDAGELTNCRRWITRPDKMQLDPFGERTVRANMHPGHLSEDFTGQSGPDDPWLTVLSIRTRDGRPVAVLANFSMHYFGGHPGLSADYFGRFVHRIHQELAPDDAAFVGIMSQGTSGDLWWGDYSRPPEQRSIEDYTDELVERALAAYRDIEHESDITLAMAEKRMTLARRTPDEARLRWARQLTAVMGDRRPENRPDVYAMQAIYLHENPTCEVVLQAIRIGDCGIATLPNEVYGLTGLKIKLQSPLVPTMNIELANGASGYIPPPEQHRLGGYNTWPARTAGLEVEAEPKMVEALLALLEEVAGKPRREFREGSGGYAQAILAERPLAYYRLAELAGDTAGDASGHRHDARYIGNFAFHLDGPASPAFAAGEVNRGVHCVGGRLETPLRLGRSYSVEMWCYNGLVHDARGVTGALFSFGEDALAISGTGSDAPGRLTFGDLSGTTPIERYTWNHILCVRDGDRVAVYLNGAPTPEIEGELPASREATGPLIVAATADDRANFEGRLDEVAVYPRALSAEDAVRHYELARVAD